MKTGTNLLIKNTDMPLKLKTHIKRRWILIEDKSQKGKWLIDEIFKNCPDDEVFWIDTNIKENEKLKSDTSFTYECMQTVEEFKAYFDHIAMGGDCILLMDIAAPLFDEKVLPGEIPVLRDKAKEFMNNSFNKLLVLSTGAARPTTWVYAISPNDDRILTLDHIHGFGQAEESPLKEGCEKTIGTACREWIRKYKSSNSLKDFYSTMGNISEQECHENFDKNQIDDIGRLWNTKYDLPVQMGALIDLLLYKDDGKQFLEDFEIRKEFGGRTRINEFHVFFECLKSFGTGNSNSISLLATLIIAWSAHRQIFTDSPKDKLFKECIEQIELKEGGKYIPLFARASSIVPPQSHRILLKTSLALFEMFKKLFRSQKSWTDNLSKIEWNENGLIFELKSVDAVALIHKLKKEYNVRYFKKTPKTKLVQSRKKAKKRKLKDKQKGGGDTSKSILDFLEYATYCDQLVENELICGTSDFPFKIQSFGEGVKLFFGNE